MPTPKSPKIYHITHIENLESIVKAGCLRSNSVMSNYMDTVNIGLEEIKRHRLTLPVHCHPQTFVGEYVPFNFCPRSVMLYMIYCRNYSKLTYQDGQEPVIHLEADLDKAIQWAEKKGKLWAFSLSNASSNCAEFRNKRNQLDEINWNAVKTNDWRQEEDKKGKQAEFLAQESFPWHLVGRIGAYSQEFTRRICNIIKENNHCPNVEIQRKWYY